MAAAQAELARLIGAEGRVAAADDSAFYQVASQLDTPRAPEGGARGVAQGSGGRGQARALPTPTSRPPSRPTGRRSLSGPRPAGRGPRTATGSCSTSDSWALGLNWNLFNGFNREESITIRSSTLDQAEATAERYPPRGVFRSDGTICPVGCRQAQD